MKFEQAPEFRNELKKLTKKWRSLPDDMLDAQLMIRDVYSDSEQHELFVQKFFDGKRATRLTATDDGCEVVKMRLDVASLGTADKIRIVFITVKQENQITFIEIYAKNNKSREDQSRIKKYLNA